MNIEIEENLDIKPLAIMTPDVSIF